MPATDATIVVVAASNIMSWQGTSTLTEISNCWTVLEQTFHLDGTKISQSAPLGRGTHELVLGRVHRDVVWIPPGTILAWNSKLKTHGERGTPG